MHHLDSFDILRSLSLSLLSLSLSNSEIKYDTGPCNDCVKLRGLTVISIAVVYTWQFSSYIDWPIPNCRKWTPPSHLNAVFFPWVLKDNHTTWGGPFLGPAEKGNLVCTPV